MELFTGRCVCLVVLTGPVGPTLCCPANGIRLGVWFLEGGTHFALIYTLMITVYHTLPRCLLHLRVSCWSYIPPLYLTMHGPMNIKFNMHIFPDWFWLRNDAFQDLYIQTVETASVTVS
jgi:hypothetical protein